MTKPFAYNLDSTNYDVMDPDELGEYATHLETLMLYVRTLRRAMLLRRDGKITYAMEQEGMCDTLYACLPSNWQW